MNFILYIHASRNFEMKKLLAIEIHVSSKYRNPTERPLAQIGSPFPS